ncbi:3-methyl-2-oxobutanoate hydroxymethyltransferase [candidate division KSB1 bacterium]|nr:3-methyl-2-oxobutanoate hydroxymethyltransferase [candidate division KSB1 bacterium]
MSKTGDLKSLTVPRVLEKKRNGEKIAALTAYDYTFACLLDQAGMDIILVGDSGAMVFAGHDTTLPLTMSEALYHCKAVRRGVKHALLVADMPFMSFQVSVEQAVKNAGRFFKQAGADAVKIEGGDNMTSTVRKIVDAGMPVMGHLGLTPQSIRRFGGYGLQAKTKESAEKLLNDALKLQEAGAFSIVLEKIPVDVARIVTEKLSIPTIGIGAGPFCDGQILVTHDVLGLYEKFRPVFARRYADLAVDIKNACQSYIRDVKSADFPNKKESFYSDPNLL